MLDLIIRGGRVVDGTGAAARRADVGVADGRIVAIGAIADSARRIIDARDRIVSPGFIDVHNHIDAQAFWDPTLSPSPLHGVTSMFAGNCGFTIAPLNARAADYLMPMLARVEGMPLESLAAGVPWDWTSTAEFLDRFETGLAVNAGFMVGHSAIRRVVMDQAANEREATSAELTAMADLLRAGLAAGGIGFSSTWSTTHNDIDGNPVPSRWASADELIALARVCGEFEGTSLEMLPRAGGNVPSEADDVALLTAMSVAARRPLNWNLLRVEADTLGFVDGKLDAGTTSVEQGGRIVALFMPEPLNVHLSFLTGVLLNSIKGWKETFALPHDERIRRLADPAARRQLFADAASDASKTKYTSWGTYLIVSTFSAKTARYAGRRVGDIAAEEGKEPFDALLDIIVADDLRTDFMNISVDEPAAIWKRRAEIATDPRVVVGGSDAGAHLDMITTHSYCTNMLANLVRTHQVLTLEAAVRELTSVPAALYGLRDRGTLTIGGAADIVVFDEDSVGSTLPTTRFDLPAGAGRLYTEATGIDSVIVNGNEIVHHGEITDARPGRLLRSGRDTRTPSLSL